MSTVLEVRELRKNFGGLAASDGINLQIQKGEIHAIIGPNGAGKTTLINQLAGELAPDSGSIVFEGREITHTAGHQRALMGMGRSFQISAVINEFTVLQNVMLAAQAHAGSSFSFFKPITAQAELLEPAQKYIQLVGLADATNRPVHLLAHGQKRQLELAMTLAGQPSLLLLDEPMAGMSHAESQDMVAQLNSLKGSVTIVLIEHDMDAVFALADRISVLVYGRVIACDTPSVIRNHPAVREAYLGTEEIK